MSDSFAVHISGHECGTFDRLIKSGTFESGGVVFEEFRIRKKMNPGKILV
jgi:hypothetical protein